MIVSFTGRGLLRQTLYRSLTTKSEVGKQSTRRLWTKLSCITGSIMIQQHEIRPEVSETKPLVRNNIPLYEADNQTSEHGRLIKTRDFQQIELSGISTLTHFSEQRGPRWDAGTKK